MMIQRRIKMLLAGALVVLATAAVGCGDDDDDDVEAAIDRANEQGETMGRTLAEQARTELEGETADSIIGEAGSMLLALDAGEVAQAQAALDRARRQSAREYAQRMVEEHTRHATEVQELLTASGVSPIDNQVTESLEGAASTGFERIRTVADIRVDLEYLLVQIEMHRAGEILLERLIDLTEDDTTGMLEDLTELLERTRDIVSEHRDLAEDRANDF